MKIYLTRHGQTDYNKHNRMQGHADIPLNETGIAQAEEARKAIGDITFDAVYSSPLNRAVKTASIIGAVDPSKIITDSRLIEVDMGRYEGMGYHALGPAMILYWLLPEVFPAPPTVETVPQMVNRSRSFLKELEKKDYDTVLVTCHGGIIRALSGYLEDRKSGIVWRPKPRNCEIRIYESVNGNHKKLDDIKIF